jgi:crotonobetainyl-CoA:carnitine CoA-transferase CaiB-like acyl-CoA transferase
MTRPTMTRPTMTRPAPLVGIGIVDLTQVLAGPYCTYQLARLGAEVIKVEPPGGEWIRLGGGDNLAAEGLGLGFCVQNSDKQFVEVDLKDPAGLEAVLTLAETADVFIQNYRPGVARAVGFGNRRCAGTKPEGRLLLDLCLRS